MEEPDHYSIFESRVSRRGKIWKWSVCTDEGDLVMRGLWGHPGRCQLSSQQGSFSAAVVCGPSAGSAERSRKPSQTLIRWTELSRRSGAVSRLRPDGYRGSGLLALIFATKLMQVRKLN